MEIEDMKFGNRHLTMGLREIASSLSGLVGPFSNGMLSLIQALLYRSPRIHMVLSNCCLFHSFSSSFLS